MKPGGWVDTWYGFCNHFLQTQGIQLYYASMSGNSTFWLAGARQLEVLALAETPSGD